MSVPRRAVLQGFGSAALGLAAAPLPLPATAPRSVAGDVHPVEHFRQLRQVLIENDDLFGPHRVLPVVREQIALIDQLRSRSRGADQRGLARVEAQYAQFHGWLYQDAGEYQLAESCMNRALTLAHLSGDNDLAAYLLARKAHLAGDMHLPADAVGAAEQALRMAPPRSRIAVTAATFAGHGYALNGDRAAMERTYDRAHELLDTMQADPNSPAGTGWLDGTYIALQRARSTTTVGDYLGAARRFRDAIADMPGRYRRGRGLWLARAASANAGDRQVEHAVALGLDALDIAAETNSASILTELSKLRDTLLPWQSLPSVAEFRNAVRDTTVRRA